MEPHASANINVGVPSDSSTGVTLILNLRGNGPFTVNINLNSASEDRGPSTPPRNPHRVSALRRDAHTLRRSVTRTTPYSRPSHGSSSTPRPLSMINRTTLAGDEEVPETPQSQHELLSYAPPGVAHHDSPLRLAPVVASPAKSDSSITESDSSVTAMDSQEDAPTYFENCRNALLRACMEFNKQEEEEESQENIN
ncbi:hypothetical protein GGX14DRAFT_559017 [Mycena pura]|uniref:Uncharacterized protein n=1 Tax=Mycena pura TaxID=153505 RepID=A0AAD6YK80_9AGAR|nr:hypothetical protein GGX14DRAFT_578935 [Mycena pura]KAJ7221529.1 hypothetical protein GGX14DRAFT_559017 [Mycena pura]